MLKIFVDTHTLLAGEKLIPLLYLFFGQPDWNKYHDSKFNKTAFDNYCKTGFHFLQLTTMEECDFIVFPYDYSQVVNNDKYADEKQHYAFLNNVAKKPILIFWNQDMELKEELLSGFYNYYLFHNSFFKTEVSKRVFIHPFFIEDSYKTYPSLAGSIHANKPSVSFCGFAPYLGIPVGKYFFKELFKYYTYRLKLHKLLHIKAKQAPRTHAVKQLMRCKKIQTNFIIRTWSGFDNKKGMFIGGNDAYYSLMRREYFENMNSSDYVLCVRGNGNFSIRFYETLCHGKIPVFIDTDTALPFEQLIDWSRHAVIINNINKIEKGITDFHSSHINELKDIKTQNRKLWEEYFTPEGFFKKLAFLNKRDCNILNRI